VAILSGVGDLTVLEVVASELEAVLVCSILRDAGVPCMHRVTNLGAGAMDGLTSGGPREIVVYPEQLELARRVICDQRDGPRPSPHGRSEAGRLPPPVRAVAATQPETPDDKLACPVA
jgi:hypothetical protein